MLCGVTMSAAANPASPADLALTGWVIAGAFAIGGVIWLLTRSSSAAAEELPPLPAPPLPIPESAPPANAPANTPGINPASTPAAPAANPGATTAPVMNPNVAPSPASSVNPPAPTAPTATPTDFVWIPEPTPCVNSTDCAGNEWCKDGKCVSGPCKNDAECGAGKYCESGKCFAIPYYSTKE